MSANIPANDGHPLAYSVEAAARALGVGKSTVWRMVADGRIRTFKLGARTLIRREELTRLIDEASRAA